MSLLGPAVPKGGTRPMSSTPFDVAHPDGPMPRRRRLLRAFQAGLQDCGIASAYVRIRKSRGAVILMYHSVAEDKDAQFIDPRNHLPASVFEQHVAFLHRHRRLISMSELVDHLERGRDLPAGTTVLTFDDGYRDTLTVAGAVLNARRLPSITYLPTGYIARGETQWADQLYTLFRFRTRHFGT